MNTDIITILFAMIPGAILAIGYLAFEPIRRRRERLNRMARQQAARHNDYLSNLKIS